MAEKAIRRLGERLNHLFEWIGSAEDYDVIWDLCCDHGRLGLHLHKKYLCAHVHLVDKVAAIVDQLVLDFGELNDGRLSFITADVCELEGFEVVPEKRTLVIVAGVGGQNLVTMLDAVLARLGADVSLDFILSPNSHTYELRDFLRRRPFFLLAEAFVTEKRFSHEHLWLRYDNRSEVGLGAIVGFEPVSAIGDSLWQNMTETKRVYIRKLLQHYQRVFDNRDSSLAYAAIKAYEGLF